MRLHSATNFLIQKALSKQTRDNFFYGENMTSYLNYVTATLRAFFAWRGSYTQIIIQ